MSTTPPEEPSTPPGDPNAGGRTFSIGSSTGPAATLPIPGNAEFALYVVVVVVLAIVWAASDVFDAGGFATATTVLTSAYFLSRGIAKASRVYEL